MPSSVLSSARNELVSVVGDGANKLYNNIAEEILRLC